jgi:hypothetical protein
MKTRSEHDEAADKASAEKAAHGATPPAQNAPPPAGPKVGPGPVSPQVAGDYETHARAMSGQKATVQQSAHEQALALQNKTTLDAGKKLADETSYVPAESLKAPEDNTPYITAPTVTPKGKLGYMPTPALPVTNPGAPSGSRTPDAFVEPVVETSVTKGAKVDRTEEDGGPIDADKAAPNKAQRTQEQAASGQDDSAKAERKQKVEEMKKKAE